MVKVNKFSNIVVLLFGLIFVTQANAISDNNGIGNLTVFPDVSDELSTHTQFVNVTMFNNSLVNLSFTFTSPPINTKVWQWQNISHAIPLDFNNTIDNTIHNQGIGGARYAGNSMIGVYYYNLNNTHISLYREANDQNADGIRVRIWKYT